MTKRLCRCCRKSFDAERRSAIFCGATCRKRHHRNPDQYRLKSSATLTSNSVTLELVPLSFREACEAVERLHRHSTKPTMHLFSIGAMQNGALVGAVIVMRPAARHYNGQRIAEVSRLVTDGSPHVASKLYAASARAVAAMGYRSIQTYTLDSEPGTSLKAAGWSLADKVECTNWGRTSQRGQNKVFNEPRNRWVKRVQPEDRAA